MVRDGVSCRETAIVIHRTDAANCAYGPPVTSHSCVVDHTERIDRSFLRWDRFAYSVCSGESRLGMIGALYTSVRLEEDWLRAALYFVIFLGLIFTGAGKFSIDRLLQTRKTKQHRGSVF